MKAYQIILIVIALLLLLLLDRCTVVNITTASVFKSHKYDSFNYLKDGVSSDDFELIRIKKAQYPILYDTLQNTFYINSKNGLYKINGKGEVVFKDSILVETKNSLTDFINHSYYVFTEDAVYDYSKDTIKAEKFTTSYNENGQMEAVEWGTIFKDLYKKATVVIYESDRYTYEKCQCYPIYFKIENNWSVMYTGSFDSEFSQLNFDFDNYIGQVDLKNFPPKFNKLVVLRDNDRKMFSDKRNTDDDFLNMYFTVHGDEQKLDYSTSDKLQKLFYSKENIYNEAAYTSIPISFGGIAYYELTIDNKPIFFKEHAIKDVGWGKFESNLYLFQVPKKFRSKTQVRFLDFRYQSNRYQSGSEDLYIIKRK